VQEAFAVASRLEKQVGKEADQLLALRQGVIQQENAVWVPRAELDSAEAEYKSLVTELQQQASVAPAPAPVGPPKLKLVDLCDEFFDLGSIFEIDEVSFFEADGERARGGRGEIAKRKGALNSGVSKLAKDWLGPLAQAAAGAPPTELQLEDPSPIKYLYLLSEVLALRA
ncbi:unnamed protein product, partial [Prorocentrum cordatum]